MTCRCAPALVRLDKEVTARYPDRDQRSDGCCASSAHTQQNPKSDHEPRRSGVAKGYAVAADIDEDLTPNGPGPDDLTGLLFHLYGASETDADPRVRQIIYEDFLYYPHHGPKARGKYAYTGINPHRQHLHVGIFDWAWNDMGLWLPQEDDDMYSDQDRDRDARIVKLLEDVHALLTQRDDPSGFRKQVDSIEAKVDEPVDELRRNVRRVGAAVGAKDIE